MLAVAMVTSINIHRHTSKNGCVLAVRGRWVSSHGLLNFLLHATRLVLRPIVEMRKQGLVSGDRGLEGRSGIQTQVLRLFLMLSFG